MDALYIVWPETLRRHAARALAAGHIEYAAKLQHDAGKQRFPLNYHQPLPVYNDPTLFLQLL